ncbi:MAG: CDP-glycerol glycerophosphotransferase family protein [Lachnospiraceae bacterium]|nr:CDP-glycerol glycerophosphotransferase family protein [Lachnospiraceae bacterium]
MNIKFFVRQLIKMTVQSVVLPVVYNVSKKKNIDEKLVIFADAHHTQVPYSMSCMRQAFEDSDYKVVDMYNNYQTESYVSVVKSFMRFMKLYANAKYVFICDNFLPVSSCNKRKETTVVQLWHAGGLLKKYAYDTLDDIPKYYKGNVYKNYTLTVCSAPICIPVYERAMKQERGTVKATGLSRSDLYFDENYIESCKEEFYKEYPEAKGKKVLLWAPTFRGKALEPYVLGIEDVDKMKEQLGEEWYVISKMHPHVEDKQKKSSCVIPTERLLPVVDMLMADYSSVIFDYVLLHKPMVLFVPDYDEYIQTRGLYIDLKDIPATLVTEGHKLQEAVLEECNNFDIDKVREFSNVYMGACDGNATRRILDEIGAEI